ncbi:hypothetical protein [Sphingomonas sp.]|jgi:hypothetical protein|uniref:hypothetical protein n=1 Tax=Sphingomonas sp. TaxID=28214 RepID=UPI002D7EDFAD|nr:hypothetical protein [Sphingomonas sp.]HEU0043905.1 hypothetical protein [Sphingomonas sp.]
MTMRMVLMAALVLAAPGYAQVAGPGVSRPAAVEEGSGAVPKRAPINGVLTLYGNERCPTDTDGNEVVVCVRRSAAEQFRVPKELREFEVTPENAAWAAKAQGTLASGEGVNSIGSCSVVGPGGQSGCFLQSARANRAENKARAKEARNVP